MILASLATTILRYSLPAVLAATLAAYCTAKSYRLKIENLELQHQAAAKAQEAKNAVLIAAHDKAAAEVAFALQDSLADLDDRYRDAAARLRALSAGTRRAGATAETPIVPAGEAACSGLSERSGEAAGALIQLPVDGTVALLRQCDLNTQKLQGWQLWYEKLGEIQ